MADPTPPAPSDDDLLAAFKAAVTAYQAAHAARLTADDAVAAATADQAAKVAAEQSAKTAADAAGEALAASVKSEEP